MGAKRSRRVYTYWRRTGNAPSDEADIRALLEFERSMVSSEFEENHLQRGALVEKALAGDKEALAKLTLLATGKPLVVGGDADVNAASKTLRKVLQRTRQRIEDARRRHEPPDET